MIARPITPLARLCTAVLVTLGMTALGIVGASSVAGANERSNSAAGSGSDPLYSWGYNTMGQLGGGFYGSNGPDSCPSDNACSTTPGAVVLPPGVTPTAIAGGGGNGYAIGSDGHLYAWGGGGPLGGLGNGSTTNSNTPVVVSLPSGVTPKAIAASEGDGYAIGSDGNLYAWGGNGTGQLGDGSGTAICGSCGGSTPVVVSMPTGVTAVAIAAGGYSAYAIGSDGHLYAWGYNIYGQLGDGTDTGPSTCGSAPCSSTPIQVSLPSGVTPTAVASAGFYAGYALGSDGKVYAWGDNYSGELGVGSTTDHSTPVQVSLPAAVTPTAIGGGNSPDGYAIGSDGHLYAWGANSAGQLGDGTDTGPSDCNSAPCSTTPVQVSLPSGVTPTAVAGAAATGYAIGSNGHLYAWGDNSVGEFGDGNLTGSSTPAQVPLPSGSIPQALGSEPDSESGYVRGTNPTPAAPVIGSTCPTTALENAAYACTVLASGFPTPTLSVSGEPSGISFTDNGNGTGSIGGDPTQSGSFPIIITAANGVTPDATQPFTLAVTVAATPVITLQPTNQTVDSGGTATFTAAASGNPAPTVQWQYSLNGGTTWADLSGATSATLSGVVTSAENGDDVRAVFTNSVGSANTNAALLTVLTPPTIESTCPTTAFESLTYTCTVTASGGPTPSLSVSGEPAGISFIDNGNGTGSMSGDPSQLGSFPITVSATNGVSPDASQSFTLTVTPPPPPTTHVNIPSNGSTVSGDVWVGAGAQSVVGIKSVSFEVTGGSLSDFVVSSTVDTTSGWLGGWGTTDVPNGTYTLQSVATDNHGNSVTSPGVTITVENLPLHTQVVIPSNEAALSGSGAILDASASGTSEVTGVQYVVTGGSLSDHVVGTAVATMYGWIALWDTTAVPNGSYVLQSVATETGGTTAMSPGVAVTVKN